MLHVLHGNSYVHNNYYRAYGRIGMFRQWQALQLAIAPAPCCISVLLLFFFVCFFFAYLACYTFDLVGTPCASGGLFGPVKMAR